MYAVLSSGGKQYRVEPGSTLTIEKLTEETGASVTFDRVLLIADGDNVTVGTPTVAGATISATVIGEELGPKIVVFKYKQKAKYRRRTGHRQHLTRVRIDEINADGTSRRSAAKAKPATADEATVTKAESAVAAAEAPEAAKPRARRSSAKAASVKAESADKAESAEKTEKKAAPRRAAKPKQAKEPKE
jgi:large subunit ribosomal protein L21